MNSYQRVSLLGLMLLVGACQQSTVKEQRSSGAQKVSAKDAKHMLFQVAKQESYRASGDRASKLGLTFSKQSDCIDEQIETVKYSATTSGLSVDSVIDFDPCFNGENAGAVKSNGTKITFEYRMECSQGDYSEWDGKTIISDEKPPTCEGDSKVKMDLQLDMSLKSSKGSVSLNLTTKISGKDGAMEKTRKDDHTEIGDGAMVEISRKARTVTPSVDVDINRSIKAVGTGLKSKNGDNGKAYLIAGSLEVTMNGWQGTITFHENKNPTYELKGEGGELLSGMINSSFEKSDSAALHLGLSHNPYTDADYLKHRLKRHLTN